MKIDQEKCISCLECLNYCPMGCILEKEGHVYIEQDECVECGVCLKSEVCPADSFYMPEESFEYPRAIRMQFSDPGAQHPNFKSWGRGTEEAKTNDVTGKFKKGNLGMLFEFGRPVTGTRFTEIEKVTKALAEEGIILLEDNPIYGLLDDKNKGTIKKEFLNEKILSGIIEVCIKEEQIKEIVNKIFPIFDEIETVVSVGVVSRFVDGEIPVIKTIEKMGIQVRPNAKINVGLGRPIIE